MTTLSFPTLSREHPSSFEWAWIANTRMFRSPMNGAARTREIPGGYWRLTASWTDLSEVDAGALQALLVALQGQAGRVAQWNWGRPRPRGTIAGTPLVNGAGQAGKTLNIDGVTNGTTLNPGDLIGVNGQVLMVAAPGVTAAGGAMAVPLATPLRAAPADNAVITLDKPLATFMLADSVVSFGVRAPTLTTISAVFVEALS